MQLELLAATVGRNYHHWLYSEKGIYVSICIRRRESVLRKVILWRPVLEVSHALNRLSASMSFKILFFIVILFKSIVMLHDKFFSFLKNLRIYFPNKNEHHILLFLRDKRPIRFQIFFSPTKSVDSQEVQKLSARFVCHRIIEQTGTTRYSHLTFLRDNVCDSRIGSN